MLNLFFTGAVRYFIFVAFYYIFLHLKEENYWIDLIIFWSMNFKSKQSFNKSVTRSGFFKSFIKSFKNYYVLGFFENFGSFLVLIQNWKKKRMAISNFLVFGAAKSMNSRNLFQGRWYRETTLNMVFTVKYVPYWCHKISEYILQFNSVFFLFSFFAAHKMLVRSYLDTV